MLRSSSRASSRGSDRKSKGGKSARRKTPNFRLVPAGRKNTPQSSKKQPEKKMKKVFVGHNHPLKGFLRVAHSVGEWADDGKVDSCGRGSKRFLSTFDSTDEAYQSGLQVAASIVDPGSIYTFRLAHYATLSSDVGGVVSFSLTCDPSSWTEWSSLNVLFTQCRLRRSHLHLINAFNRAVGTTTSNGNWQPSILNALYDEVAAPTSYDNIIDTPNFKVYNHNFDTTKSGIEINLSFTGARTPLWGDVSAPHSSTAFTGTPGCFQVYADGQTPSTVIFSYVMVLDIEFMNRF